MEGGIRIRFWFYDIFRKADVLLLVVEVVLIEYCCEISLFKFNSLSCICCGIIFGD